MNWRDMLKYNFRYIKVYSLLGIPYRRHCCECGRDLHGGESACPNCMLFDEILGCYVRRADQVELRKQFVEERAMEIIEMENLETQIQAAISRLKKEKERANG